MNETKLRKAIRKEILESLKEKSFLDRTRSTVSSRLGRVANLAGVKLLKKALAQGSPDQQAAGILSVIKALADGDDRVIQKLKIRLQQSSVRGSLRNNPDQEV